MRAPFDYGGGFGQQPSAYICEACGKEFGSASAASMRWQCDAVHGPGIPHLLQDANVFSDTCRID